ncbi:hypothetical protein LTR60_007884 [Cryomyces antarcticus]|nr:hypothetical protein LTR60_007884 [Cryomyces antarcticus]
MRPATLLTLLLPTLASCSAISSQPTAATSSDLRPVRPAQTEPATPTEVLLEDTNLLQATAPVEAFANLDLREIVTAPAAAQPATTINAATQVPPITTAWLPTKIGTQVTYLPVVYTQTFVGVPSQGAGPLAGSVGMGTLTGTVGAVRTGEAKTLTSAAGPRSGSAWSAVAAGWS